jgi:hypothetical protein
MITVDVNDFLCNIINCRYVECLKLNGIYNGNRRNLMKLEAIELHIELDNFTHLEGVANMPKLERLYLTCTTQLTGADLKSIIDVPFVSITTTEMDQSCKILFQRFKELHITFIAPVQFALPPIDLLCLAYSDISGLPRSIFGRVRRLSIRSNKVTDGLVKQMTMLNDLDIELDEPITDDQIKYLYMLNSLRIANNSALTGNIAWSYFMIVELTLDNVSNMSTLQCFGKVQKLAISGCPKLRHYHLITMKHLRILKIGSGCHRMIGSELAELVDLTEIHLVDYTFRYSNIFNYFSYVDKLETLSFVPSLKLLSLDRCSGVVWADLFSTFGKSVGHLIFDGKRLNLDLSA